MKEFIFRWKCLRKISVNIHVVKVWTSPTFRREQSQSNMPNCNKHVILQHWHFWNSPEPIWFLMLVLMLMLGVNGAIEITVFLWSIKASIKGRANADARFECLIPEYIRQSPHVRIFRVRLYQASASTLRWPLRFCSHWKRRSHFRMGLQIIFKWLHCFQWEQNRKHHRRVDADAWYKQALRTVIQRPTFIAPKKPREPLK